MGIGNAPPFLFRAQENFVLEKLPDALGHALRGQRAGLDKIAFHAVDLRAGMASITVSSLAFVDHAPLPARYTADGAGVSPPLQWRGVPAGAASLALIVEDADAPTPIRSPAAGRSPARPSLLRAP